MGKYKSLIVLFLILLFYTSKLYAITIFVDDDYGNLPPGNGTKNDPFHQIQSAINAADYGDIILVKDGTYNESIQLRDFGLETGPIATIISENGWESTKIQGFVDGPIDGPFKLIGFDITESVKINHPKLYIFHCRVGSLEFAECNPCLPDRL
jgi:hypothetical protein